MSIIRKVIWIIIIFASNKKTILILSEPKDQIKSLLQLYFFVIILTFIGTSINAN